MQASNWLCYQNSFIKISWISTWSQNCRGVQIVTLYNWLVGICTYVDFHFILFFIFRELYFLVFIIKIIYFLFSCCRRSAEADIGQGRTNIRCITADCKSEFSLSTLKKVLKPAIFSSILEKKQLEEIAAAGIEDLEACPFCNFQTIMPNKEDKVFKCLNPECMKDSCR